MARGRVLFPEHRRRAASLPADDLGYPDSATINRLYNIRSSVVYDTEALLSASKRHDRDFLHRVQNTLVNPSIFTKTPPTLNHNRARGPPPSRSAYYVAASAAAAASLAVPSSAHRDLRRRTWYGPASKRVDDYEVDAYLATPIRPPFVSRALRAGSVPPVLPSSATAPRWYPTGHVRGTSVPRWAPSTYRTYGSGLGYLQTHPDMEDIVVGIAPTIQYGDIVIGIPYRKQFMFDVQHGLDAMGDYPRIPLPPRVTSPYFAYRSSPYLRSYDDSDITPYHHYSGSRYSYPYYRARASVPSYLSYSHTLALPSTAAPARFSTIGYPVRAASARHYHPVITEHLLDLPGSKVTRPSFSNLRLRTSLAHDKAKEHKAMLDRFLPTEPRSRGSLPISSLATSIAIRGSGVHHVGLSGPYSLPASVPLPVPLPVPVSEPVPPTGAVASQPFKPQISETRQKVRDLLCKSKKDPHYFE